MEKSPVIYWYRDDLRLHDLPGLQAAVATGRPVLACYILDDESPENWRMGGASRWWLHHSLVKLSRTIEALGGTLSLARGRSEEILERLARNVGASNIFCSRSYEPWSRELEERVQSSLGNHGVQLACTEGTLLWEPEQVKTLAGTPYKVYTPFWRACMSLPEPRQPGGIPTVTFLKYEDQLDVSLADLDLLSDENIVDSSWQTY
jgi:deoxyribodipyrimidine photo-lyase